MQRRVLASFLALTAFATAWQLWRRIMWGVWGKPADPFESVALFGSLSLLASSGLTLGKRKAGIALAAFGCVLLWLFYGPAVWNTIEMMRLQRDRRVGSGLIPPGLLIVSSFAVVATILSCGRKKLDKLVAAEPAARPDRGG
jgi:hypothetical protein